MTPGVDPDRESPAIVPPAGRFSTSRFVVMVECKTFHFDIRWSEVCERRELACGHADLHGPDPTWSGTIRGPIHCARKPAARSLPTDMATRPPELSRR